MSISRPRWAEVLPSFDGIASDGHTQVAWVALSLEGHVALSGGKGSDERPSAHIGWVGEMIGKGIASLGVCGAVAVTVYVTKDGSYLWALLALLVIW